MLERVRSVESVVAWCDAPTEASLSLVSCRVRESKECGVVLCVRFDLRLRERVFLSVLVVSSEQVCSEIEASNTAREERVSVRSVRA